MRILSTCISHRKGTPKRPVPQAILVRDHGMEGDAHAGPWHRQVSFLAVESLEAAKHRGIQAEFGDFAENIATEGIPWPEVPLGARFRLGSTAVVEITQIGKTCHTRCAIYHRSGDCIMPKEGVFARVVRGGIIRPGDPVVPLDGEEDPTLGSQGSDSL